MHNYDLQHISWWLINNWNVKIEPLSNLFTLLLMEEDILKCHKKPWWNKYWLNNESFSEKTQSTKETLNQQ